VFREDSISDSPLFIYLKIKEKTSVGNLILIMVV
jgi:hypothetical protein